MWVEILLGAIILIMLIYILFAKGGLARAQTHQQELDAQREELRMLREANEALRGTLGINEEGKTERREDLFQFVRDLEGLRGAIAGSKVSQSMLYSRYRLNPGPELFEQVLKARQSIDPIVKRRLADEILVGEAGRSIMRSLNSGATIESAAAEAGMPLAVAKGQITRLQILGYLDSSLKPTVRGREALV